MAEAMMVEKSFPPGGGSQRNKRTEDGLGPNSDIGAKLRALYGAVQDEAIPEHLLDLLEKLDQAESHEQAEPVHIRSK